MKNKTCCFTGHRKISLNDCPAIQKQLEEKIIELIHRGIIYFGNGGALVFDTLAALTILKLKKKYPQIRLIMVLPCPEQDKYWSEKDKKIYNQILRQADKAVYISEHYYNGCMQKRNRHLVDNSSICICYLNRTTGGTAYTVKYAKEKGLTIINIAQCD